MLDTENLASFLDGEIMDLGKESTTATSLDQPKS